MLLPTPKGETKHLIKKAKTESASRHNYRIQLDLTYRSMFSFSISLLITSVCLFSITDRVAVV